MKVCIVVGQFPKLSETFVVHQVLGLIERGHDVSVLCRNLTDEVRFDTAVGRELMVRSRRWWGRLADFKLITSRLPAKLQDKATTALDLTDAGFLSGFDVIIAHFGHHGARVARLKKRASNLPPIVTIFHGHDVGTVHQTGEVGQYQNLFRLGSRHLPVNARFREILIANGAPVERTHVHHMGIDAAAIPFERRDWTLRPLQILSVARLTEKKGISSALMALAKVRGQRPELSWRYKIVGEGELREDLGVLSAQLGLTDSVEFLGARPHVEVRRLLAKAQLFLLPSVTAGNGDVEGIPVSLMEAMASGAIVVSSIHSGIPELVEDGVSGLLAPERDVDTLAKKLLAMADHPDSMDAMAWNARQTVESEFNSTVQMERLETELIATLNEIRTS